MSPRLRLVIALCIASTLVAAAPARKQSLVKEAVLLSDPQDMHTTDMFFRLYEERFTEEELAKLVAFLKGNAGRKFLSVLKEEKKWLLRTPQRDAAKELERSRANGTRASIRAIATALIVRSVNENRFPPASTIAQLAAALEPKYITQMPRRDSWGAAFHYVAAQDGPSYRIVSGGPDGTITPRNRKLKGGVAASDNIVYEDGLFLEP